MVLTLPTLNRITYMQHDSLSTRVIIVVIRYALNLWDRTVNLLFYIFVVSRLQSTGDISAGIRAKCHRSMRQSEAPLTVQARTSFCQGFIYTLLRVNTTHFFMYKFKTHLVRKCTIKFMAKFFNFLSGITAG